MSAAESLGALVTFSGLVRPEGQHGPLSAMLLEHYPGMTESSIGEIVAEAKQRWALLSVRVRHRVGLLLPGEPIVFIGVASSHRAEAFTAAEFIMDYLKLRAPFWKQEISVDGEAHWVDQKASDLAAAGHWQLG